MMNTIDGLCCYSEVLDTYSQKLLNIEFDQNKLCQEVISLFDIIRIEQCECEARLKSEWKAMYQRLRKQDISVPDVELILATSLVYDCAIAILACSDDTFYNYEVTGYLSNIDEQNNSKGFEDRINSIIDIVEVNQEDLAAWVDKYMSEADNTFTQDTEDVPQEVKDVFVNTSDFVKDRVKDVVAQYFKSKPVNMALIEVTLYDHNVIFDRTQHQKFIDALVAWGIVTTSEKEKIVRGMTSKCSNLSQDGYLTWPKKHKKDQDKCKEFASILGPTIKYRHTQN